MTVVQTDLIKANLGMLSLRQNISCLNYHTHVQYRELFPSSILFPLTVDEGYNQPGFCYQHSKGNYDRKR